MRKFFILLFLVSATILFSMHAYAQDWDDAEVLVKQITGEIIFIDGDFISIVYDRQKDTSTEYEMMLYISPDVQLENIDNKDLGSLEQNDLVKIEYLDFQKQGKSKRVARKISLIKRKRLFLDLKGLKTR